jgi:hypothetical protein
MRRARVWIGISALLCVCLTLWWGGARWLRAKPVQASRPEGRVDLSLDIEDLMHLSPAVTEAYSKTSYPYLVGDAGYFIADRRAPAPPLYFTVTSSDAFCRLVGAGAESLPLLLKHLDDARPVPSLKPWSGSLKTTTYRTIRRVGSSGGFTVTTLPPRRNGGASDGSEGAAEPHPSNVPPIRRASTALCNVRSLPIPRASVVAERGFGHEPLLAAFAAKQTP